MDKFFDLFCAFSSSKDQARAGWVKRFIDSPETQASHMWGAGVLAILFEDRLVLGADPLIVIKMCLIANIHRAHLKSDIENPQKFDPELNEVMVKQILDIFPIPQANLLKIWQEYHEGKTPSAKMARDFHTIDRLFQAFYYETSGRMKANENDFLAEYANSGKRLNTELGNELLDYLLKQYVATKED